MRKRCTRQHFIEYLSYNYVEKQSLLARCTWDRHRHDYGFDGFLTTFAPTGEVEPGRIDIQVKSTDNPKRLVKTKKMAFDLSVSDLDLWLISKTLVILVLYDAKIDIGYFLDVQKYFRENRHLLKKVNKFIRIYFSEDAVYDKQSVEQIRILKNS